MTWLKKAGNRILAGLGAVVAVVLAVLTFSWVRSEKAKRNELADQAEELGKLKGEKAAGKLKDAGAAAEAHVKGVHAKLDQEAKDALKSGSLADDIAKLGGK